MRKLNVGRVKWFTKGQITSDWHLRRKLKYSKPHCVQSTQAYSWLPSQWCLVVQLDRLWQGTGQKCQSCQTVEWITGKCGITWIFPFPSRFDSMLKDHLESRAQEIWLQRPEQYSESESGAFPKFIKWSGGFWCIIYSIRLAAWKLVSSVEKYWKILDWECARNFMELDGRKVDGSGK